MSASRYERLALPGSQPGTAISHLPPACQPARLRAGHRSPGARNARPAHPQGTRGQAPDRGTREAPSA
jgi:hypothetical protein